MVNQENILSALGKVKDPEIKLGLVELNMIQNVVVEGEQVSMNIKVVEENEKEQRKIKKRINEELAPLGITDIKIQFIKMSSEEEAEVAKYVRQKHMEKMKGLRQGESKADPLTEEKKEEKPKAAGGHQADAEQLLGQGSKTEFIAVASGKGGVGKSTATVNLAVSLARAGKKVGIIDADIYGFSVPDMMGIISRPKVVGKTIYPVERYGVKVMSMGFFVEENAPVIWRGPMLGKMIRNFLNEVDWGELDYMLIDLPPGTGDVAMDISQMIPKSRMLIVTTPHATAAFVAARAGAMALHTNHDVLGVIENMSYYDCNGKKDFVFGQGGGEKLAAELNTELLAQIPLGIPDNGSPEDAEYSPSVYGENSATGKIYDQLARTMIKKTTT
ncbi:Mrp/NBP35 family ATP-binding protein [Mechercharimyces sp. CAU 1602]|uniref:Mrp/NBP35 family ATP-binding protein n=1 Tax=Mechercharimyces sp. CAU 1602 TaxID=2973933 RepID=UPI002867C48B|nr:Mrp/NBP35 family ATP-binding protein [Mechercharimyces sp. CAU 1602]